MTLLKEEQAFSCFLPLGSLLAGIFDFGNEVHSTVRMLIILQIASLAKNSFGKENGVEKDKYSQQGVLSGTVIPYCVIPPHLGIFE